MRGILLRTPILIAVALFAVALTGCRSGESESKTIVLYGSSIPDNVTKEEIIPAFQERWRTKTGQNVQVVTSFVGSGTITNQIILGAPVQVAIGGAQWAVLALYGSALMTSEVASGAPDNAAARELLKRVSLNAGSLPESARKELTQLGLGYGDALLTYETEALVDISKGKAYEIVVPRSTIYIEPKVLTIDGNIDKGNREVTNAFVEFLWSKEVQRGLARHNFRVPDQQVINEFAHSFQEVELPFTVDYPRGWEGATSMDIDRTWRQVQREIV